MKKPYINPQTTVVVTFAADPIAASATGGTANPFGRDSGDGGMFPDNLDFNKELPW